MTDICTDMTKCFQYNAEKREDYIILCQAISLLFSPFHIKPVLFLFIFYFEMGLTKLPRLAFTLFLLSR